MSPLACTFIFIAYLLTNFVSPQFSGDFWWLHDKAKALQSKKAPPAQFEKLNGLETDETDKIVFDISNITHKTAKKQTIKSKTTTAGPFISLNFRKYSNWTADSKKRQSNSRHAPVHKNMSSVVNKDEFSLHFPIEDNFMWESDHSLLITTKPQLQDITFSNDALYSSKVEHNNNKLLFNQNAKEDNNTENICTFLKEDECRRLNGHKYIQHKGSQSNFEICCILPLEARLRAGRIVFPEEASRSSKRYARSPNERQKGQDQRTSILKRNNKRILTPDEEDYGDPYDNIRNFGHRKPNMQVLLSYPTRPLDYVDDEEYADELPKPGLVGLYSDPDKSKPWQYTHNSGESVLIGDDFGYGVPTLDPRIDKRISSVTKRPLRRKPSKQASTATLEKGVERISYQSKPDFQVLQGFKLLNLVKNKNRVNIMQSKIDSDSPGLISVSGLDLPDTVSEEGKILQGCGYFENESHEDYGYDKSQEQLGQHSQPWIAVVSRRRAQRRSLCFATLVHPRAAVTVASCVFGTTPGEIVVHAGTEASSLAEESSWAQSRVASVHVNARSTDDNGNDIALLHWSRPFKMSDTVRPICLDDPRPEDVCLFVGWNDAQEMWRQHLEQHRAAVLTSNKCIYRPRSQSFCASIGEEFEPGPGAALVCKRAGRWAAVGVAVRRDRSTVQTVLLAKLRDWTLRALADLGIA